MGSPSVNYEIETPSSKYSVEPPPPRPGFISRLAQSVGFPQSQQEAMSMLTPQPADLLGPDGRAMVGYAKTAISGLKQGAQEAQEAGQQLGAGQITPGQMAGKAAYGGLRTGLEATPAVGPAINQMGQDAADRNWPAFAGGATGVVGQIVAPEVVRRLGKVPSPTTEPVKPNAIAAASNLNSAADITNLNEQAAQNLFKKSFAELTVSQKLQTIPESTRLQAAARAPKAAYRTRDAGETGIIPHGKAQASLDPTKVQGYMEGRGAAQNHPQELVKIDLTKLDPSEYTVHDNGYVTFKSAVPESFIEKVQKPNVTATGKPQKSWLSKNQKQMAKYGIKVPGK